jgi:prevent-host-death family protein
MRTIGLFEAKAKLSAICDAIAKEGKPVIITRRGRALVRIEPIAEEQPEQGVWQARSTFLAQQGQPDEELVLPVRRKDRRRILFE